MYNGLIYYGMLLNNIFQILNTFLENNLVVQKLLNLVLV